MADHDSDDDDDTMVEITVYVAVVNSVCGCGKIRHEIAVDHEDVRVFRTEDDAWDWAETCVADFRRVFEKTVRVPMLALAVESANKKG